MGVGNASVGTSTHNGLTFSNDHFFWKHWQPPCFSKPKRPACSPVKPVLPSSCALNCCQTKRRLAGNISHHHVTHCWIDTYLTIRHIWGDDTIYITIFLFFCDIWHLQFCWFFPDNVAKPNCFRPLDLKCFVFSGSKFKTRTASHTIFSAC